MKIQLGILEFIQTRIPKLKFPNLKFIQSKI